MSSTSKKPIGYAEWGPLGIAVGVTKTFIREKQIDIEI
jgi:hypothetical protein